MNKFYGILFNKKSGEVVNLFEGTPAQCKLLAMSGRMGLTKTRDFVIFDKDGVCQGYFEGKANDFPNICNDMVGKDASEFGFDFSEVLKLFEE